MTGRIGGMRSAFGCAGLGLLLLLVAGTFDAEPLYATGSALALLGLGAAGWIAAGAHGAQVRRELTARSARVRVQVVFGRRGRRRLAPPALVLRDPFGLAQRVVTGAHTDEVLVLPRVLPVRATAGGGDATPAPARSPLIPA